MDYTKEINEALKSVCKRAYQEGAQEKDKVYNLGFKDGYERGQQSVLDAKVINAADEVTKAYKRGNSDLQSALLNDEFLESNYGCTNISAILRDFAGHKIVEDFIDWEDTRAHSEEAFQIGDEVVTDAGDRGVIVAIGFCTDSKAPVVMNKNGSHYKYMTADKWHKTGKHYAELNQLMNKLNS